MKFSLLSLAVLAAIVGGFGSATAQTQRSGGEAQKFMQQYQQLAAEKTQLQGQLVQMKKDLDDANSALAATKKERDALKVRASGASTVVIGRLTASKASADKALDESRQRTTELVARFRETLGTLKDVEADRATLRGQLDATTSAFDKCAENNQQLYDINGDILNRFDHMGAFTKVSTLEPFTRLTRIRLDNLVVETRARADELRVKRAAKP